MAPSSTSPSRSRPACPFAISPSPPTSTTRRDHAWSTNCSPSRARSAPTRRTHRTAPWIPTTRSASAATSPSWPSAHLGVLWHGEAGEDPDQHHRHARMPRRLRRRGGAHPRHGTTQRPACWSTCRGRRDAADQVRARQGAEARACGPIVVLNKVDRPNAEPDRVLNDAFDLFAALEATDEQPAHLRTSTLAASRAGRRSTSAKQSDAPGGRCST